MLSFFFQKKQIIKTLSVLSLVLNNISIAEEIEGCVFQTKLEFQEAYRYALANNIKTLGTELEIKIREAERVQVGLYPNPQLNVSFDGPSSAGGWYSSDNDIAVGLTQLFELGGKRRARVRVAEAAQFETSWSLEIAKCDLYADVMHAFIETAIAQEKLGLAQEFQSIAEQSLQCISSKNECGKTPLIEAKRADIVLKMAKLASSKRFAEMQKAKIRLASFWNSSQPNFGCVDYDLFNVTPPPPYCQLSEELENNPILIRAQAEVTKAWEILRLEETRRIPDMAVYVGVSTTYKFHDPALNFGVNIPIPIFDRNQGNIARADREFNQVILRQNDLINQMRVRMKILYKEWSTAYQQAADLKEIVETTANEAYQLAEDRYSLGNSNFLEFLDARSTLYNLRQDYLQAIEEYHHKRAEVMQLLAKCCSEVFNG